MNRPVPPETRSRTTYYDTAHHDLAAHGVSLGRCIGSGRSGWLLTLPSEPETGLAPHMSVSAGDENVPDALRDIVLAIVRDRPMAPATPTKTTPRASADGSKPKDGTPNPARHAVCEQLERLLAWDRAVRVDAPDAVHQMRVAIRTIHSLLQASPEVFGLAGDAWLLEELRELATVLGTARDAEVLAQRYQRALDALPANLIRGPVRTRLVDGARDRYQSGLQASIAMMRSARYFRLLDALDAVTTSGPSGIAGRGKPGKAKAIVDGYERVCKRVEAAAGAPAEDRDAMLHCIRKSAKRLRYVAAAQGAVHVAKAATAIQTLLGDHQDSVVSRANLAEQADAANAAGADTFTYGVLYQREIELAEECERELPAALKSLGKAVHKAA